MKQPENIQPGSPLVREKALQPFSHDHHQGLLVCWKIRAGINKGVDALRIRKFCIFFYHQYLLPHFEKEEQYLFPLLSADNQLIKIALAEHDTLRRMAELIEAATGIEYLIVFEKELSNHIRFEERVLFSALQKAATPTQLEHIALANKAGTADVNTIENWPDEFWI